MEVTKHNFREALKEILSLLKEADFISFDAEFSGLGRSQGERINDLDTPRERYEKYAKTVKEYGLIQIGVSFFRFCKEKKKYFSATYCFFLAGKGNGSYRYDSSSMTFLAENGFDFNKLFLEGLPFMTILDEEEIRKKREEKLMEESLESSCTPLKIKDVKGKAFLKESIQKVKESSQAKEEQPVIFEGKSLTAFLRKVLFSNVATMFPTSHFMNLPGSERNIKVLHFDSEEKKKKFLDETWEQKLWEQLGFTHIVKAIVEANKPLVGHNMILDILYFVDKFISPLPDKLDKFKPLAATNLPKIYDTKLIAKDPPFSAGITNTCLGSLYEDLLSKFSPPEFEVEERCQSYKIADTGQAHDGGFDAFMTGVCFATMLKTLNGRMWTRQVMSSECLKTYENRINFMGSYDIPFIELTKPDEIPNRSYIYCVTCPSSWTMNNVRTSFNKLKGFKAIWDKSTRLYVIPLDAGDISSAKMLLKDIRASCPPTVKVVMYDESRGIGHQKLPKPLSTKDIIRPSLINLKRRSWRKEATANSVEDANASDVADRSLKRLKSVGSELLSSMSLESPVNEEMEPTTDNSSDKQQEDIGAEIFNIPDDWR